jgi:hypothetical protein
MTRLVVIFFAALLFCHGLGPGTVWAATSDESSATSQVLWGPTVNGLRCSITLSHSDLRVGDPVVAEAKIQNISDKPITIHYARGYYEGEHLAIETAQGEPIRSNMSGITEGWAGKPPFERIAPGATFTTSINGRAILEWVKLSYLAPSNPDRPIILDFRDVDFKLVSSESYRMSFRLSCDDKAAASGKRQGITSVWTGSLESNAVPFSVKLRTREELDRVIEELRSGTADEKAQAVQAITANLDRQAVPALVEAMAAGVAGASQAVGALGDSSLVSKLMQMYREAGSDNKKEAVLDALQMASRDVIDFFAEVVKSDPSAIMRRNAAARMADMALMRKISAVHALLAVLKTPDTAPKCGAIDGLAKLEDELLKKMVTAGLVTAMKSDPDRTVRERAAGALGGIGDASVVPALIEALKDPNPWVGSYAAHSLGRLAGPEAIKPLQAYRKIAQTKSQAEAAIEAITKIQQRVQRAGAK